MVCVAYGYMCYVPAGCLALQVKGQGAACFANNTQMCNSRCTPNSADGNCCLLDPNEPDMTATPLGFIDLILPGTDRLTEIGVDPPCVRVIFPDSARGMDGVYLVVGVSGIAVFNKKLFLRLVSFFFLPDSDRRPDCMVSRLKPWILSGESLPLLPADL